MVACDLRLALGEAQRQAGLPASRETFLDAAHRAHELGATDRLVAAALGSRGFFSSIGVIVSSDKVEVLESALDALGDDDGREPALLLATLCSELALGTTESGARNWPTPPGRWRGGWGIRPRSSAP